MTSSILNPATYSLRQWVTCISLVLLAPIPAITEALGIGFYQDVFNRMIILAIAAVSLNLILGYGAMISFGHAAYIGIGAYCVGIPAYYEIYSGFIQIPIAVAVSALFALVTGAISLRTKGVYFIMITMAFTQMLFFALISIEEYGADDGLLIDTRSEFGNLLDISDNTPLYFLSLASLCGVLYLVHRLVNSRFGMVIQGAKDNEARMQSMGFPTYRYRLTCYVISGAICGYAGALLGNFTDFITPEMMDWTRSGELIFMVVVGGAGSLFGPVLGTAFFVLTEEWLSRWTTHWHFIFGIMLILIVIFVRGGIDGLLNRRSQKTETAS